VKYYIIETLYSLSSRTVLIQKRLESPGKYLVVVDVCTLFCRPSGSRNFMPTSVWLYMPMIRVFWNVYTAHEMSFF